ncbi:TPA: hypothetical protein ACQSKB_003186 [Pseudomonas aeruginosa]
MSQILERYRLIAMISPLLLLAACSHAPHSADPPRLDVPAHFSNEEGGEGILDKSPAVLFPSIGGRPTAIRTSMPWSGRRWSAIPN